MNKIKLTIPINSDPVLDVTRLSKLSINILGTVFIIPAIMISDIPLPIPF